MRGSLGGVEQWAASLDLIDVVDPKTRMLEQVRGLIVNLERIVFIQQVWIEPLAIHTPIVLQTTTLAIAPGSGAPLSWQCDHIPACTP